MAKTKDTKVIKIDNPEWFDAVAYKYPDGNAAYWIVDFEGDRFSVTDESAPTLVKLLKAIIKEEEK